MGKYRYSPGIALPYVQHKSFDAGGLRTVTPHTLSFWDLVF